MIPLQSRVQRISTGHPVLHTSTRTSVFRRVSVPRRALIRLIRLGGIAVANRIPSFFFHHGFLSASRASLPSSSIPFTAAFKAPFPTHSRGRACRYDASTDVLGAGNNCPSGIRRTRGGGGVCRVVHGDYFISNQFVYYGE